MKTIAAKIHDVGVRLVSEGCSEHCGQCGPHDEPALRFTLPDNCGCGEPLDTPTSVRDVQDTAIIIFTLAGAL